MQRKFMAAAVAAWLVSPIAANAQGYPTIDAAAIEQAVQILGTAQQTVGQLDNLNGLMALVQQAIGTAADSIPIDVSKWTGQLSSLKAVRVLPDVPFTTDPQANSTAIRDYFYSQAQTPTRPEIEVLKLRRMRAVQRAALNAYTLAASTAKMLESSAQDLADLESQANAANKLVSDVDVQTKALLVLIARQNATQILQAANLELAAARVIADDSNFSLLAAQGQQQ